jgi:hypothetical protein
MCALWQGIIASHSEFPDQEANACHNEGLPQ